VDSNGLGLLSLPLWIPLLSHLMVEDAAESAFVPKEKQELSISL